MRVSIEKTVQEQPYEPIKMEIEVSDSDFPGVEKLSAKRRGYYLYYKSYLHIMAFRLQHGNITKEQATDELRLMKGQYHIDEIELELAFANADPLC